MQTSEHIIRVNQIFGVLLSELTLMRDEEHIDNEPVFVIKEKLAELRNELLLKIGT
jgi:hypothetical protein